MNREQVFAISYDDENRILAFKTTSDIYISKDDFVFNINLGNNEYYMIDNGNEILFSVELDGNFSTPTPEQLRKLPTFK